MTLWITRAALAFFLCLCAPAAPAESARSQALAPGPAQDAAPPECPLPVALKTAPFSYTEDLARPHKTMLPRGLSDPRILAYVRAVFENKSAIETPRPGCEQLVLSAGYSAVSLIIAKELASDPCSVQRLREHELSHIAVYERHLATLESRFLKSLLSRHSMRSLREPGALAKAAPSIQALLQSELESVLEPNRLIDEEHEAADARLACEWDQARRVIFNRLPYRRNSDSR